MNPNFWSNGCIQKKNEINEDPNFRSNGRMQIKKKLINEEPNFKSNGRVQMKKINQCGPQFLVEWSCTNKKIKLMRSLILGRMVVYKS